MQANILQLLTIFAKKSISDCPQVSTCVSETESLSQINRISKRVENKCLLKLFQKLGKENVLGYMMLI